MKKYALHWLVIFLEKPSRNSAKMFAIITHTITNRIEDTYNIFSTFSVNKIVSLCALIDLALSIVSLSNVFVI
jgi:hypothetical protein